MKTDKLVALLAASGAAVDRRAAARRFWWPVLGGAGVCVLAVLALVGVRADWRDAIVLPMFWMKLAFPAATAWLAALLLKRLGHPGVRSRAAALAVAAPVMMVWLLAAAALLSAGPQERSFLVFGKSWLQCLVSIPALSVPAFALTISAIRSLAPTRLAGAGAASGLVAGAVAAFAYALYCDEMQAPFLAVWYVLGMALPALVGAMLGPRLLRW